MTATRPVHPIVSTLLQSAFRAIPETPLVYWLCPRFFELVQSERRLKDVATVKQGRENATLRMEREILRNAAAFFAKETS